MFDVPYHRDTYRIPDVFIPGNSTSDNPTEFDLVPAWGADWARVKSIIVATTGLATTEEWSADMQKTVIAAFETGGTAFINTVTAVRGLTIPAAMAIRAGIIEPKDYNPEQPDAKIPITSGLTFSRVCGALPTIALMVASKIAQLSNKAEIDGRFFVQPSGSGGTGIKKRTRSNATSAPRTPRRRATAASPDPTASQPAGTSVRNP